MPDLTGVKRRCRKDCPPTCRKHSWAWHADVGRDPVTGKRVQLTGTAPTQKEAAEARADAIRRHRTGGDRVVRETLADYLAGWYARKVEAGKSPSTLRNYREHIDLYIAPVIGSVKLSALRLSHVEEVLAAVPKIGAQRAEQAAAERTAKAEARAAEKAKRRAERESQGRRTPGPKPKPPAEPRARYREVTWETQRDRVFATLRSALNSAVKRGELARNPCGQVEAVTTGRARRVDLPWTLHQLTGFLGTIDGERLGSLYALATMTGMRRGELVGLRWEDVDVDGGVITVRQQHVAVNHTVHVRPAKTEAGRHRRIRLDAGTVEMLRAVLSAQRRARLAIGPGWQDIGLVFTWEDGRPFHPGYVSDRFSALLERLSLPHIRLHDLRHMSATLGAATGETLLQVSRRLGHSSIRITGDLYSHVWDEQDQAAADARAALLRGTGTGS